MSNRNTRKHKAVNYLFRHFLITAIDIGVTTIAHTQMATIKITYQGNVSGSSPEVQKV